MIWVKNLTGVSMEKKLIHNVGRQELEIARNGGGLYASGQKIRFKDAVSDAILAEIIKNYPDTTPKENISAILIGHHLAQDGISKAILHLRSDLIATGLPDVIKTVRAQGYTIFENWEIKSDESLYPEISNYLDEISELCSDLERQIRNMKYVQTSSGVQIVAPDSAVIQENFAKFHRRAWSLLTSLSQMPSANEALVIKLKKELYELCSYAIFWRMSTRHEEGEWKEEYRREVEALREIIELMVRRILK